RVWRASEQIGYPYGTATQLLILTGARREEISRLRWSELPNAEAIKLSGERTKNSQPFEIPLSAPARAVIARVPRVGDSAFVFTPNARTPISGWSVAKKRLDQRASTSDWRLHDLRRTVATGIQKLGINLQTIEAVLGHVGGSRSGVVGTYQRYSF